MREWRAVSIAILALNCFAAGLAQNEPEKMQESGSSSPVIKATTRLVIVDVVATNSKGEAVSGLSAQDFKVLENGKEQAVRVFDFQRPNSSVAAPAQPPSKLPANVFNNAPAYKPPSAFNVVLLDLLNTAIPRQTFVRYELLRFLEKLPAGTPIAIYAFDGNLRLIQDFTDDPRMLRAAAERMQSRGSALLDNPAAGPPMVVPLAGGAPPQIANSVRQHEQAARDFTAGEQVQATLAALSSLAHRLVVYPGRKNLIWISDGFPFYINPRSESQNSAHSAYQQEASRADTVLMESQVAIYPIDAHAEQVASIDDIGYGKLRGLEVMHGEPLQYGAKDFKDRLAVHATMNELAQETGGQAFYNTNGIDVALRKSMDDGSTYYILGYYPQDKNWDGKFRKIEVAVGRPGVKLRYRLGYYALEPMGSAQKAGVRRANLHEALDLNSPISSALLFQAAVLGPSDKTHGQLVVNFGIDPHTISFEKGADGLQHASLECAVEAYSEEGKLIKSEATNLNAALPPDVFARVSKSYFPCQQPLELPAGQYRLRLGVADNRTGLIGTANATAKVEAVSPAQP